MAEIKKSKHPVRTKELDTRRRGNDAATVPAPKRAGAFAQTAPPAENRSAPRAPRVNVFAIGDVIDEIYEIVAVLGEGGMGQVFEAIDRGLDRRVAIKVPWPIDAEAGALRIEARALAALRHASMITVHHLGRWRGLDYVVMERIYGVTLAAHIERRQAVNEHFAIAEVLDILTGIGEGLAVVHSAGLSHGDVKPVNVMLAPGNRIVLMDFGLTRPEYAQTQVSAGTPDYMAPETILGSARVGERFLSDLYSLGVVAYEVLTLNKPFGSHDSSEIMQAHLTRSAPDPAAERPDCPPELARLIRALLAKEPNDRPASLDSVLDVLRASKRSSGLHRRAPAAVTVLIVEDDPAFASLIRAIIRSHFKDAVIATACDADEALRHVHGRNPDVLLLDLHLPDMNGIEFAMLLRGTNLANSTRIVAMSGRANDHDVALLRQLGIEEFLVKREDFQTRLGAILATLPRSRQASA